jgi:hypothetical protein
VVVLAGESTPRGARDAGQGQPDRSDGAAHGLVVATRNTRDFQHAGVTVEDRFAAWLVSRLTLERFGWNRPPTPYELCCFG